MWNIMDYSQDMITSVKEMSKVLDQCAKEKYSIGSQGVAFVYAWKN